MSYQIEKLKKRINSDDDHIKVKMVTGITFALLIFVTFIIIGQPGNEILPANSNEFNQKNNTFVSISEINNESKQTDIDVVEYVDNVFDLSVNSDFKRKKGNKTWIWTMLLTKIWHVLCQFIIAAATFVLSALLLINKPIHLNENNHTLKVDPIYIFDHKIDFENELFLKSSLYFISFSLIFLKHFDVVFFEWSSSLLGDGSGLLNNWFYPIKHYFYIFYHLFLLFLFPFHLSDKTIHLLFSTSMIPLIVIWIDEYNYFGILMSCSIASISVFMFFSYINNLSTQQIHNYVKMYTLDLIFISGYILYSYPYIFGLIYTSSILISIIYMSLYFTNSNQSPNINYRLGVSLILFTAKSFEIWYCNWNIGWILSFFYITYHFPLLLIKSCHIEPDQTDCSAGTLIYFLNQMFWILYDETSINITCSSISCLIFITCFICIDFHSATLKKLLQFHCGSIAYCLVCWFMLVLYSSDNDNYAMIINMICIGLNVSDCSFKYLKEKQSILIP